MNFHHETQRSVDGFGQERLLVVDRLYGDGHLDRDLVHAVGHHQSETVALLLAAQVLVEDPARLNVATGERASCIDKLL